jgi:phosphopantetheine--protein transferase-like protein
MPSTVDRPLRREESGVCLVGVDLVAVRDVAEAIAHFGTRYTGRLFTEHELATSAGPRPAESLAARFAAKEAVVKVLAPSGASPNWRDMEVRRRPNGACRMHLHGRAAALARARGIGPMSVSLCHEAGLAVAVVVAMRCDPADAPPAFARPRISDHPNEPENRSTAMTTTESTERIRGALTEHGRLPVDVATLSDDDDLFQAGMTSHASVNVMLALEDTFDVEFPVAMLRKSTFASIGALRRALSELAPLEVTA